jgi:hypothetical protein
MQLEGSFNLERRRVQRWVPIVAIVVPVFLFVTGTTWFIRAFVAPPMAAIPAPMTTAAIRPPERLTLPAPSPQPPQQEKAAVPAYAEASNPTAALPMFGTFALAPPSASLRTAPPAVVAPDLDTPLPPIQADNANPAPAADAAPPPVTVASLPQEAPEVAATAALEFGEPIAGPIPLPPQRPPISTLQAEVRVPLPRARPTIEEVPSATSQAEQRMFSAHGAE